MKHFFNKKFRIVLTLLILILILLLGYKILIPNTIRGYTDDINTKLLKEFNLRPDWFDIHNKGEVFFIYEYDSVIHDKSLKIWGHLTDDSIRNLVKNKSFKYSEYEEIMLPVQIDKHMSKEFVKSLELLPFEDAPLGYYQTRTGTAIYLLGAQGQSRIYYYILKETGFFYVRYWYNYREKQIK